jgi:hypothetical protein
LGGRRPSDRWYRHALRALRPAPWSCTHIRYHER